MTYEGLTSEQLLGRNAERRAALLEEYDPMRGIGSHLERQAVEWDEDTIVWIPTPMVEDNPAVQEIVRPGGLPRLWRDVLRPMGHEWDEVVARFTSIRMAYDPELWFATSATIKLDAETRQATGDTEGPFILNRAQRIYLAELCRQFFAGTPVRIILLKARQWGGSTLTQLFMAWVQQYWRRGWNIFICAIQMSQAAHIRKMYQTLADNYPRQLGAMNLVGYEGQQNVKYVPEVDSIIGVTSIERPDSPRSFSIHMAHLSEVGLWKSTPKVNAEDYAQAITGAVPQMAHTMIVEESTARGVGTYFHKHWMEAGDGRSSYEQVFIPWHAIPKYRSEWPAASADRERLAFAASMSSREWEHWHRGAALEQVRWYRAKLADFKGKLFRMQSEYPSTPDEAFQSTGNRYFALSAIQDMRRQVRPPAFVGDVRGAVETGPGALEELRLVEDPEGPLKIWTHPGHEWPLHAEGEAYKRRYCGYADFGGKSDTADWSVLTILDRAPMVWMGAPVVAAQLRVHLRPDLYAWKCAQLAELYDRALLALEINRHRDDRGDEDRGYEPEWGLSAIVAIHEHYDNLYIRHDPEQADERLKGLKIGFHLNQHNKPILINQLDRALEEGYYIERAEEALDEFMTFEQRPDGSLGAVPGNHDDIVISRAGSLFLALKYMDPPVAYAPERKTRKKHVGAAQF